jgi:hypothetical protein
MNSSGLPEPALGAAGSRYYASFSYQAQSWKKPRRVVAKVEWHPGELYPRVGFIVTNLARPVERVVAFYNQRGTAEQWIKEGKGAIKWTRLSCRSSPSTSCARLQSRQFYAHTGDAQGSSSMVSDRPAREADQNRRQGRQPRSLRQLAEVAVPRQMFQQILSLIARLRAPAPA